MQPAVIVNANAGATRRNPRLPDRLERAVRGRAELYVTTSRDDLERTAHGLAARQVSQIAVVGGDGTASNTLTALCQAYRDQTLPSIALLRGGTMNTVANALHISRGTTLRLLSRALRAWDGSHRPRYISRAAIQIGERLGFLFGTGIFYGWMNEYYEQGHGHPTPLTAAKVLGKSVASALMGTPLFARIARPEDLEVRFEGGVWQRHPYLTVGAGTVDQAGLGFRPFYRCAEDERRFHLVAIKGRPAQIAADLPAIWLGRGMRACTAHETTTSWAELRSSTGSFGYSVDGDLHVAHSSLRLQVGPLFRILRI